MSITTNEPTVVYSGYLFNEKANGQKFQRYACTAANLDDALDKFGLTYDDITTKYELIVTTLGKRAGGW